MHPERILWTRLCCQQLGTKFRRQHGIGHYIVDFYCAEFSLVIELDGDSHYRPEAWEYDKQRDAFMQSRNIRVLRIANNEVINNLDGVLSHIIRLLSPHDTC
ncbi:endonuclease domain-containing protein [Buttiauxella gaviniae]|uniref:Endonuclease domain-containing protein n=1 Tax=Buttiauxella gaviniae TaxID=82990 RepID=A0ABV3NT37_9ENTR